MIVPYATAAVTPYLPLLQPPLDGLHCRVVCAGVCKDRRGRLHAVCQHIRTCGMIFLCAGVRKHRRGCLRAISQYIDGQIQEWSAPRSHILLQLPAAHTSAGALGTCAAGSFNVQAMVMSEAQTADWKFCAAQLVRLQPRQVALCSCWCEFRPFGIFNPPQGSGRVQPVRLRQCQVALCSRWCID